MVQREGERRLWGGEIRVRKGGGRLAMEGKKSGERDKGPFA